MRPCVHPPIQPPSPSSRVRATRLTRTPERSACPRRCIRTRPICCIRCGGLGAKGLGCWCVTALLACARWQLCVGVGVSVGVDHLPLVTHYRSLQPTPNTLTTITSHHHHTTSHHITSHHHHITSHHHHHHHRITCRAPWSHRGAPGAWLSAPAPQLPSGRFEMP